jgi:hypothetical protein
MDIHVTEKRRGIRFELFKKGENLGYVLLAYVAVYFDSW